MFSARRTLTLSLVLLGLAVLCLISPHSFHLEGPGAGLMIFALGLLLISAWQRSREKGLEARTYADQYQDPDDGFGASSQPTTPGSGYIGLNFPKSEPPERL